MKTPMHPAHEFTLTDGLDVVLITTAAATRKDAADQLASRGWEMWRRELPPFPKMQIGETADFDGHEVKRETTKLYTFTAADVLRYTKADIVRMVRNYAMAEPINCTRKVMRKLA